MDNSPKNFINGASLSQMKNKRVIGNKKKQKRTKKEKFWIAMKEISSRQTRGLHFKFKVTKLHVDEDLYREARNAVQNLIRKKEKGIL